MDRPVMNNPDLDYAKGYYDGLQGMGCLEDNPTKDYLAGLADGEGDEERLMNEDVAPWGETKALQILDAYYIWNELRKEVNGDD